MGCIYDAGNNVCAISVMHDKCDKDCGWYKDKEENYQAYIDELHKQVEDLKIKLLKAEFDAEIYKEAILKAFMKWSDKEN